MKRVLKIIASTVLVGVLLASCERVDIEGIGELNKLELWYSPYAPGAAPLPGDCVLIDHIEKDLGISLTAVPLPDSAEEQDARILEAARTNELPDIFMVSLDTLITLVRENWVCRVDRMYELMPERTLQMYDSEAIAAASVDGISYGLAHSGALERDEGILIRKDWLEKLGLEIPVTLDDFYNVMKAFTFNDPDGDGLRNTYGYGAFIDPSEVEDGLGGRFAPFFGAFGAEGTFDASKEKPRLSIHKPEFKEALDFVSRFVKDGLIDPKWAIYTKDEFHAAWKAGRFGIMREQNADFALEQNYKPFDERFPNAEWILINPPVGPNGRSSMGAYDAGYRILAVSRRAQELGKIPVIARLLEWMSTDGYTTVVYGEEAVNYMVDDNGEVTTEGLPDPRFAYTQPAAAPLLQLRNLVLHNSNKELEVLYPAWRSKNGKEMDALKLLRQMQKKRWTRSVNIPPVSKEFREFYEEGIRDLVLGRIEMGTWNLWLKEFDSRGGADWERQCILYAEEGNLLMDDNSIFDSGN